MANPRPEVSGLSPKTATSAGGIKVTIRGQHLGINSDDLIGVTLCGIDHLTTAEWVTPQKVTLTTLPIRLADHPDAKIAPNGKRVLVGNVFLTTASGGQNQQTLPFTFEEEEQEEDDGDSDTERDVWVNPGNRRRRAQHSATVRTAVVIETLADPLGVYKGVAPPKPDAAVMEKLVDMYPNGSGDPSNANFIPAMFLAEKHSKTPLDLLTRGSRNLNRLLERREEDICGLMKDNFDRYVACQDAILTCHQLLQIHQKERGGDIIGPLHEKEKRAKEAAEAFIQPLLSRRKRVESIRNVLNVMQRFKFLFTLPYTLEKNIANGEYEAAVADYQKAKSLYGETEIVVFQRIMTEVEHIANKLREMLDRKLQDPKTSLKMRERLIEYLIELGTKTDPAWTVMGYIRDNICSMLNACAMKHRIIPENEETISRGKELLEATEMVKGEADEDEEALLSGDVQGMVRYTRELTLVMSTLFPRLWKLSHSYFHGNLHKRLASLSPEEMEAKKTALNELLESVLGLYDRLIRTAFFPTAQEAEGAEAPVAVFHIDSPETGHTLLRCVQVVIDMRMSLLQLKGMTGVTLQTMTSLVADFVYYAVTPVCDQVLKDIRVLWDYDLKIELGPSVMQLPEESFSLVGPLLSMLAPYVNCDLSGRVPNQQKKKDEAEKERVYQEPGKALPILEKKLALMLDLFADCLRYHALSTKSISASNRDLSMPSPRTGDGNAPSANTDSKPSPKHVSNCVL
eukprot:comp23347_c0_seq2/m.38526 comp23347_c0_seq2/g.38526  ORF comp23347_c0_seq2/g.38526 comp23347_c0_seq2/m.38526 type:complete len:741 (-) comp23347_c0_seq2:29-2251(-)